MSQILERPVMTVAAAEPPGRIRRRLTWSECLASDLSVELGGRETLIPGIIQCETARDYVSRELLREILSDTEEHIDFLEMQLGLVKALGEQNYLQSAVGELPA